MWILALMLAAPMCHAQVTFTEYPIQTGASGPYGISAGPDGNLWFGEYFGNKIGKITPAGVITEFPVPTSGGSPTSIAAGPDGNLWFTEYFGQKIGRITTAGVITEFPLPSVNSFPQWLARGPDGNLWFTETGVGNGEQGPIGGNRIGRITTAGVITEFPVPTSNSIPFEIAGGPDGNLWFTESRGQNIGRITPAGVITEFPAAGSPASITAGPDGNLWFGEHTGNNIGRITPAGVITEFTVPTLNSNLYGITTGPDGNLWYTGFIQIGKITTAGVITEVPIPTSSASAIGITTGSDGNLWFTEFNGNKIGRIQIPPTCAADALSITLLSTNHGGNAGQVTVQMYGCGFGNGTQVKLTGLGADIVGTNTTVSNGSVLTTTLNLTGATPGARTVVITNAGATSVTLPAGFTVEQGGAPQIWVDIIGRDKIRIGSEQTFYIAYGNAGNIDWNGLAFAALKVPVGIDPVSINFGNQLAVVLHPQPLSTLPFTGAGISNNAALVGTLVFPPIPASGSGTYSIQLALPAGLNLPSVPIELDPFGFPPALPPSIVNLPGQFLVSLIELKGQELGIGPPQFDEAFLQAFEKALTDALKDTALKLALILSDHLFPEWLRDFVHDVIETVNDPTLNNAKTAFEDYFDSVTTGSNGDFFDSALYANYQQCQQLLPQPAPSCKLPEQMLSPIPVTSLDPNDKVGPQGVGAGRYISGQSSTPYSIDFDNQPTATAPAQTVTITDTLSPALELNTLALGQITLPNQVITPPSVPLSLAPFSNTLDLRPTNNLLVKINASLDISSRVVTWSFQSLDPATDLPPTNPLAGFLPPGAEGSVFFTVLPKSTPVTGTVIQNTATVVFDANPPINTPTWSNTIDSTQPISRVSPLPSTQTLNSFPVQWSGTDVGAGIQDFTIYVSDNGGAFTPWLVNAVATQGIYSGVAGHSYGFYSIARDLVGNVEPAKTAAEATTTIVAPPQVVVTRSLSRDRTTNDIVVVATIANTGGAAASNVQLTIAKIGSTVTKTTLPQSVGTIVSGSSAQVTVRFPGSAGSPGATTTVTLGGTYTGGSFTATARTTLP
jgi:streptogramin lyase